MKIFITLIVILSVSALIFGQAFQSIHTDNIEIESNSSVKSVQVKIDENFQNVMLLNLTPNGQIPCSMRLEVRYEFIGQKVETNTPICEMDVDLTAIKAIDLLDMTLLNNLSRWGRNEELAPIGINIEMYDSTTDRRVMALNGTGQVEINSFTNLTGEGFPTKILM